MAIFELSWTDQWSANDHVACTDDRRTTPTFHWLNWKARSTFFRVYYPACCGQSQHLGEFRIRGRSSIRSCDGIDRLLLSDDKLLLLCCPIVSEWIWDILGSQLLVSIALSDIPALVFFLSSFIGCHHTYHIYPLIKYINYFIDMDRMTI